MYERPLDEHIEEMKDAAAQMVAFTAPLANSHDEKVVAPLKQRKICVDGYNTAVMFSRADHHGKFYIETLEIMATHTPFLPMHLVCKIAVKFLGGHDLIHYSTYLQGHKVYVWKVCLDRRGRPLPIARKNFEPMMFEGLKYSFVWH